MDGTDRAFETIARTHARYGTTSLLLTTMTETIDRTSEIIDRAHAYASQYAGGANVLGIHAEGPFIHPNKAAAQRMDAIVDPDPDVAERWFRTGFVKMMTLAPELPLAHEVAVIGKKYGVLMAVGHTTASYEDMEAARNFGFSHITHLCNAMNGFGHREVGPIGHIIDNESYTADLIGDGRHIHPAMLKALIRSIGIERLSLITDAIRATDLGDGEYDLGGQRVTVKDGVSRLKNGSFAGSVLTMAKAVANLQTLTGVSLYDAQTLASTNPARRLGLAHKGRLMEGFDADMVAIDPRGEVLWTMVDGSVVYQNQGVANEREV